MWKTVTKSDYQETLNAELNDLKYLTEIIASGGACWICGFNRDPRILEKHHIAGKYNSNICIPVCPNCHRSLTNRQGGWVNGWNNKDNPPIKSLGHVLKGLSDILQLKAIFLSDISDELLNFNQKEMIIQ